MFVTVPKDISKETRSNLGFQEEGWGRMKASASVKGFEWDTAFWFDTKANSYVLPIKAEARKKAKVGDSVEIEIDL